VVSNSDSRSVLSCCSYTLPCTGHPNWRIRHQLPACMHDSPNLQHTGPGHTCAMPDEYGTHLSCSSKLGIAHALLLGLRAQQKLWVCVSSHKYLLSNATTSRDASAGIRTEKQQEKVARLWPGLGATSSLEFGVCRHLWQNHRRPF
jgi:hypothetical protein